MQRTQYLLIILVLFGAFAGIDQVNAKPNTYLYILNFENIQNDQPTDWLRSGFADKIREDMTHQKYLHLKNADDLEKIMEDRSEMLKQPRGSNNLLILGKYDRALDKIIVTIQLIDISTWEEKGTNTVTGSYSELSALMKELDVTIRGLLKPFIPEDKPLNRPYPDLRIETRSIDSAIEDLEHSMDIAIGAKEEFSEHEMDVTGEWSMDLNVDNEEVNNPENEHNTDMLVNVIETLIKNPYHVKMFPPRFEYDTENDSTMKVIFNVEYSLKENIIKDMLYSMPYTGLTQDGSLTIFVFNKEKFNFPQDIVDKLKYGTYRKTPVIRFINKNEEPIIVIADTPDYTLYPFKTRNAKYLPVHHFSPLVDITVGGWEINIAMETVAINVDYTFELPVEDVNQLERVNIKFISSTELQNYLGQF